MEIDKITYEFCKLEQIDLRVATWLLFKFPDRLYSYLQFLAEQDYRRKGKTIVADSIYNELIKVRDSRADINHIVSYLAHSNVLMKWENTTPFLMGV